MIDLNKQACSFWHSFFSFQLLVDFSRSILLFDNLALTLNSSNIWHIVFPITELFICSKDSFSKLFLAFVLSSVFISTYGFNHAFWFNSSTLCTLPLLAHSLVPTPGLLCAWHNSFFNLASLVLYKCTLES